MSKRKMLFLLLTLTTFNLSFAATRSGSEVFQQACAMCHAHEFLNAPQAHDVKAWQKKYEISQNQALQQDPTLTGKALEKKTYQVLVSKVQNGNKAMPPKGNCPTCSDQEYLNAILYMMQAKK